MNIENYLSRIKYHGSLDPTLQVLSLLQENHLLNIPFENLDIHCGVTIELDIDKIYSKIILHQRGGFCYELNGLFYELLVELGFNVKRISARVFDGPNSYGPEYDHLAIIADIEGVQYLSDVGFGEFCFSPLRIDSENMQKDRRGDFIVREYENGYYQVSKSENNILVPQYIFNTTARVLNEFKEMCMYHQASPESHFTQNVIVSRPTAEGRITISKNKLKITNAGVINEIDIANGYVFRNLLLEHFGIEIH